MNDDEMELALAIVHARDAAVRIRASGEEGCESCAAEHEQLASWLEELKNYRTLCAKVANLAKEARNLMETSMSRIDAIAMGATNGQV